MMDRRDFLRNLGLSAGALPFALGLPSLHAAPRKAVRKQRLVIMFSPDGVVPWNFWPDVEGETFTLKESLTPLEPFRKKMMTLKGLNNKLKGDGDGHMRGMGCLLTGIELFPGNIQGGSDTPAGWAKGISIDQEIKNVLQSNPETRTRFGSLEFGVLVPERADTWTRMVYAGPNRPIAPISNPHQMFKKFYGAEKDKQMIASVLDVVREDLKKMSDLTSAEDRKLLEEHATFVREMEKELSTVQKDKGAAPPPAPDSSLKEDNDSIPKLSKQQIDLMVNSFTQDFARIATIQYTQSVGGAKMRWLGITEGQHELSHKPDKDEAAQAALTKINKWYAEQLAYLAKRLEETPEPDGQGSMLDNTLIVWTNELGQGNSHTRNNIPFVLVGGGLDFKMGRALNAKGVPHNRFLMSLAHGFGHRIEKFGNPEFSAGGPISILT
ncbi:MAG TPA: DUF1552 domain-containing protein [Planctomycetota bacterium]|nr:DUF1552 domain-containing protein [Planctomycetota bacterium]